MAEIICAVYRIINTITGDFYIGSSKNVKSRWANHKCQSPWKRCPNNPMYIDMQKYGLDKFAFEILEEVEEGSLKEAEQEFIEQYKPTYNDRKAKGLDVERYNETHRKASKKYQKSEKGKESNRKYNNQLCYYNNETLTLCALRTRFRRKGIDHPTIEAKKYIIKKETETPIEFYDVFP